MGAREYLLGFRRPTRDYRVDCLQMEAEKRISHSVKASGARARQRQRRRGMLQVRGSHDRPDACIVLLFVLSLLTPRLDCDATSLRTRATIIKISIYYFSALSEKTVLYHFFYFIVLYSNDCTKLIFLL